MKLKDAMKELKFWSKDMSKPTDKEFIQTLQDELKRKEMALLCLYEAFGFKASGHNLIVDLNHNKCKDIHINKKDVKYRFGIVNRLLLGKLSFSDDEWQESVLD